MLGKTEQSETLHCKEKKTFPEKTAMGTYVGQGYDYLQNMAQLDDLQVLQFQQCSNEFASLC